MHAGQRVRRNHVAQHLERIVMDHTKMGELLRVDAFQQCADAREEHLDAEEIDVGTARGDRRRRLAHAEADLEHRGRAPSEELRKVERLGRIRHAVARQQFVERAPLSLRHMTATQRETADMADRRTRRLRRRGRLVGRRGSGAHAPGLDGAITPALGDDGEPL